MACKNRKGMFPEQPLTELKIKKGLHDSRMLRRRGADENPPFQLTVPDLTCLSKASSYCPDYLTCPWRPPAPVNSTWNKRSAEPGLVQTPNPIDCEIKLKGWYFKPLILEVSCYASNDNNHYNMNFCSKWEKPSKNQTVICNHLLCVPKCNRFHQGMACYCQPPNSQIQESLILSAAIDTAGFILLHDAPHLTTMTYWVCNSLNLTIISN